MAKSPSDSEEVLAKDFHGWFTEQVKGRGDKARGEAAKPWEDLDEEDRAARVDVVKWAKMKFANGHGGTEIVAQMAKIAGQYKAVADQKAKAEADLTKWREAWRRPVDPVDVRTLVPIFRTNDQEMEMEMLMARVGLLITMKQFGQQLKKAMLIPTAATFMGIGMMGFLILTGIKGGG